MTARIWLLATSGPDRLVDGSLPRMLRTAHQENSTTLLLLRNCSSAQQEAISAGFPTTHVYTSGPLGLSEARNRLLE